MTITPHQHETEPVIFPSPISESSQVWNWRNCWYPVTFVQDLPKNQPYSFFLYDEPLVVFRNQNGKLGCLIDLCPHRAAKLSDGQIIDGKIECLYHGWQFGTDGQCLHIPQLPTNAKIPINACVKSFAVVESQGIVWLWAGEAEAADETRIPNLAEWEQPQFSILDYVFDVPYSESYFIENALDPAHIHINHHGTEGNRENAQPLEIEVIKTSIEGVEGRFRYTRTPHEKWINLNFIAPNGVLCRFDDVPKPACHSGLALYTIPLSKDRCRVLARFYENFTTFRKHKLEPCWLSHLYRNRVVEEDIKIMMGLQAQVARLKQNLQMLYLPLKTSDTLVVEYRKWLDKYGSSLPIYQGYSTLNPDFLDNEGHLDSELMSRFDRHTKICSSCTHAYGVTKLVKHILVGVAIASTALAILTDDTWISPVAVMTSLSAVVLAFVAQKVKTKFEHS